MGIRRPFWQLLLLLVLGGATLAFANGKATFAAAAWIGAPLLVRALRDQPFWRGAGLAWLVLLPVWVFQWSGVFRLPDAAFWPTAVVLSLIALSPYLADRLLSPRLDGLAQTLVLPCALVANEFVFSLIGGYGAWGSLAYGQTGFPLLLQSAALGGYLSIVFLIGWWAGVVNLAWERRTAPGRAGRALLVFGLCALAVLGFGAVRLAAPAGPTLRVAAVSVQPPGDANYGLEYAAHARSRLFAASARAAASGARLIAWPEDSFFLPKADEAALWDEAAAFARSHALYLAPAYSARLQPPAPRYQNRTALFAPDGRKLWAYSKASPVPGYEAAHMAPGIRPPAAASTPIGRLAAMICFDADHPDLIARVNGVTDLLIAPSDDWPAVEDLHARMIRVRAVEIGAPILRPAINGRSLIAGSHGEELAAAPKGDAVLVADAPIRARPTPYARVGDAFAWTASAGLLVLALMALLRRGRAEPAG